MNIRIIALLLAIDDDIRLGLPDYAYEDTIALVRLLRELGMIRGMTVVKKFL